MGYLRNHYLRILFYAKTFSLRINTITSVLIRIASILAFFLLIFFEGVPLATEERLLVKSILIFFIPLTFWIYICRTIITLLFIWPIKIAELAFKLSIIFLTALLIYANLPEAFNLNFEQTDLFQRISTYFIILLMVLRHVSQMIFSGRKKPMNPMRFFVLSFFTIIAIGTGLLMLPEATTTSITFTDALFTSTSAVCVTGLVVLDTSKDFTQFGQLIIMLLIQVGALGIMTFTSFFVIISRGEGSIHNRMALKEVVNHKQFGKIIHIVYGILFMTFLFEFIGAVSIYFSTDPSMFQSTGKHIMFSVFHSVSAFCNAGFSTISGGLMHPELSRNNFFLLIIAFLIIFGGLGFFVVSVGARGILSSLQLFHFTKKRHPIKSPLYFHEINFRLVIRTTTILLLGGTLLFYFLEYDGVLKNLPQSDKWIAAFFSSVTARTAGFNSLDFSALRLPSVLLFVGLMWIGGSPGSTAGGIKTTTFALAAKSFTALLLNRKNVIISYKRVSPETLRKVAAVIFSSVFLIFTGVFFLSVLEPQIPLQKLLYEYVSALGTVGVSMDVTPTLSLPSRYIIIVTMFIGRLGLITILLAFIKKRKPLDYYCPDTTIFIN